MYCPTSIRLWMLKTRMDWTVMYYRVFCELFHKKHFVEYYQRTVILFRTALRNTALTRLVSDLMVDSLGTVAFRNNIQLSVKTLQLFQILGMENPEEFRLDLNHLPLAGYTVKVLYIIEEYLSQDSTAFCEEF